MQMILEGRQTGEPSRVLSGIVGAEFWFCFSQVCNFSRPWFSKNSSLYMSPEAETSIFLLSMITPDFSWPGVPNLMSFMF